MSTAINSTHQQDRAAQQKLINARQQANAQGPQQGVAFSQMLSLACDEDTDLDALQLGGKLFSLKDADKDSDAKTTSAAKRKTDKGLAPVGGDTEVGAATDGLHPAAQANATLLALLGQAQSQNARSDASDASDQPTAKGLRLPGDNTEQPSMATNPAEAGITHPATDPAPAKTAAPGQAVREMARQLGAAMRNALPGQDSVSPVSGNGMTWAGQPGLNSQALPTAATAQLASAMEGAAGLAGALGAAAQDAAANGTHGNLHSGMHTAALAQAVDPSDDSNPAADGGDATGGPVAKADLRTAGSEGQSQSGLGGETLGGTEMTERGERPAETAGSAESWREQWAEAMDQMGQQVSYWVSQGGVRQATLRVGNGWQQAMDVKLTMKNGQAEIEFLTDHEAARSAIAEGGTEVLRELLAQSGIDLGQVSIGAQTTGGGSDQTPGQAATTRLRNAASEAPAAPAAVLQPRHAHSTGLDVYV